MNCAIKSLLLMAGMFMVFQAARAEGEACPEGYSQGGKGSLKGCAVVADNRDYYHVPASPAQRSASTDRYGAIAVDNSHGLFIFAGSESRYFEETAKNMAILGCQAKGGNNCKVALSYKNGCAALAVGDGGGGMAVNHATLEGAKADGIKLCKDAQYGGCKIAYSECSFPTKYYYNP